MTIDEAIKVLQRLTREVGVFIKGDEVDAMKLGIEALKQEKERRSLYPWHKFEGLSGETEE